MKSVRNTSGDSSQNESDILIEYRKTGDLKLLGKLYEQYMSLVYGLCLKYFKDEEQSKDAVMQIFEELIKKLRVHEVSNFKSWLYTVARNYCLMQIRKSSKYQTLSLDDGFMENDAFVHLNLEDDTEEKLALMEKCIETLPSEQKLSIKLFYIEQRCYKEVSDLSGFEINKVKSFIQNGKRNLKICIEKNREH